MGIQNILFDLDGTLINSSRGIKYSLLKSFASVLPDYPLTEITDSLIGPPVPAMFKQILGNDNPHLIDTLTQAFRQNYDSEGWQQTDIYEGVRETLEHFCSENLRLFIVTNKPNKPSVRILDYFQLLNFFEDVVSPDSLNPPFPSKSIACQYLLTKYGLSGKNTILLGDSKDDAQAAKTCGLNFIAASYGYGKIDEQETLNQLVKISRFSELVAIVKQ